MPTVAPSSSNVIVKLADDGDRESIYRLRHDVYAVELAQHPVNGAARLVDAIDACNVYITATINGKIIGCISVTSPHAASYSIEKYVSRNDLPIERDGSAFEIRLLTVAQPHRGRALAVLLMYAALRWVEDRGGTQVIAMGRREVMGLYQKMGLQPAGRTIRSGHVEFELMSAQIAQFRQALQRIDRLLRKLERTIDWRLAMPFRRRTACFHGGAFFEAIGDDLQTLDQRQQVINADVLDAWFPPSPNVIKAMRGHCSWLMRTSPPTGCEGFVRAVAQVRGVDERHILPGAGSSDLIFRVLREWLRPSSRVLLLDPTYGEYSHVLEHVIGCRTERLELSRADSYRVDPARLLEFIRGKRIDLAILVNPNSPTGQHIPCCELEEMLALVPPRCRMWIDETYIDYAGEDQSLEQFAPRRDNVVVCKSMSKVYALSGMRAAYLCGCEALIEPLRAVTPPWVIGLPTQLAAITALNDPAYYGRRYRQTHALRKSLASGLEAIDGIEVLPGVANFLLCHLPTNGPSASEVVKQCREFGLFLRDASTMGKKLGAHALRIAVKDRITNQRMAAILRSVLSGELITEPMAFSAA